MILDMERRCCTSFLFVTMSRSIQTSSVDVRRLGLQCNVGVKSQETGLIVKGIKCIATGYRDTRHFSAAGLRETLIGCERNVGELNQRSASTTCQF